MVAWRSSSENEMLNDAKQFDVFSDSPIGSSINYKAPGELFRDRKYNKGHLA